MRRNPTVVACVGDSITYGFGLKFRWRDSYPRVLGRLLGWRCRVYNYGLSGRTLLSGGDCPYRSEEIYRRSLERAANVYLLMLGTNDSKARNWDPEAFPREWEQFARSYLTLPNRPTVIGMLPPRAFSVNGEPVAYSVDAAVLRDGVCPGVRAAAARLGIPVIDLYALTAYHPEWFQDGVHPNARGCHEMAACIAGFLTGENIL